MKKLFKIFIALMITLSMALLVSCGGKTPNDEIIGPPIDDTPLELPEEFEGVQGPIVDYVPD